MNPNQEAPAYPYAPEPELEPAARPGRSWRRTAVVTVLTGLAVAAAGAPVGVLWHVVAPTVPVIDAGGNGFVVNDPSPEEYIAADGWFAIIGLAFGVAAAVVAWLVVRRYRGPGLLLAVTAGALAGAPLAWFTGRQFGRAAYEQWREIAVTGGTYQAPPDLHARGTLLVPAFAAVIVLTLLAGWSNDPDLERPGARPGYGQDLPPDESLDPDSPPDDAHGPGSPPDGAYGPGSPPDGAYGPGSPPDGAYGPGSPPEPGRGAGYGPGPGSPDEPGRGDGISSGLPGGPDPTAAPAPHAPGPAGPPRG